MTDLELKKLKDDLWHAADVLRSGAHQVMDKDGDFGGFLLRGGCRTESAPFVRCRYLSKHRLQGV